MKIALSISIAICLVILLQAAITLTLGIPEDYLHQGYLGLALLVAAIVGVVVSSLALYDIILRDAIDHISTWESSNHE